MVTMLTIINIYVHVLILLLVSRYGIFILIFIFSFLFFSSESDILVDNLSQFDTSLSNGASASNSRKGDCRIVDEIRTEIAEMKKKKKQKIEEKLERLETELYLHENS